MKPDQERIRSLLVDTISLLCRNGLNFENELRVQAVVGVTVDTDECFVVHLNKCFERKLLQEENCENEKQPNESLQQVAIESHEPELQSSQNVINSATALMQPSRDAPPSPSAGSSHRINKPSASQDLSTAGHEQNNSQNQLQVSANNLARDICASKSDMQTAKSGSSKHESFDECAEFNASRKHGKMSRNPAPVDSDDCDDSSVWTTDSVAFQRNSVTTGKHHAMNGAGMQQQQYYTSGPANRRKLRHSVDAYRPKTKKRNLCEDLFDDEDDYCLDFNVGQQYMYIDSGTSRARPKQPRPQQQDVFFDPHCTPSMLPYGTQDVRLLALTSYYDFCVYVLCK